MEIKAILEKPFTEKEKIEFIVEQNHQLGYEIRETDVALEAWGSDDEEKLEQAKQAKYNENESVREAFLLDGVVYKDILWDSDSDQKVNLMYAVSSLGEGETIVWVGKDGVSSLECTKEDLLAIGQLLTVKTAYVWQIRNPQIKMMIEAAETIEEVEAIEISYEMPEDITDLI